jgi:hypothetical protein
VLRGDCEAELLSAAGIGRKANQNNTIKLDRAQFEALSKGDQSKLAWWLALMTDPNRAVRWT